jgi:TRAP-type mannitol/chloroaromatic compound transport system permease small subunit
MNTPPPATSQRSPLPAMLMFVEHLTHGIERIGHLMGSLAGWMYFLCAFFIAFDVISRRFLGFSSQGTTEISSYMLAFGISWALAYVLATKGHIRVDVLVTHLPVRLRAYLHVLALTFLTVLSLLFARRAWDVVFESWEFGAKDTSALSIPLIIPQGFWAVGLSVFCALTVVMWVEMILLLMLSQQGAVEQRLGARSIEEETEEALDAVGLGHAMPMSRRPASERDVAGADRE